MGIELTTAAQRNSEKVNIEPQLVLEIDGLEYIFGAVEILKFIRIGDPDLYIDGSWVIGGYNPVDNQFPYISLEGTGNTIQQQLRPDQGSVSSISSLTVQLIDKDNLLSQTISPGVLLEDILGRRATVWFGFRSTAWKEDYIKIFAGRIDDVTSGAGNIQLNIVHPDNKKRQNIFIKKDAETTAAVTDIQTTIPITNAVTIFDQPYSGVNGIDSSLTYYIKLDDELIKYTGANTTHLTGCVRGQLGTIAASHDAGAKAESFYALEGPMIDLALKTMLSGVNGPFREDVPVKAFNVINPANIIPNVLYFDNLNISEEYGLVAGDYITTTGALNGANNVTDKEIIALVVVNTGSYALIDGVSFVDETDSSAVVSFRSQYDTLGIGLGMTPEEVDVEEHHYWRDLYLSNFQYRFYLKDTTNGKEFIEKEIYAPYGGYSLPRKTKSSMGFHLGPLPRNEIPVMSVDNVKKPDQVKLRRTTARNFYNTILYSFDEQPLEDKFLSGRVAIDQTSKNRIPVGTKTLAIKSKGIRTDLDSADRIDFSSERLLSRYKYAAEFFEGVQLFFKTGFNTEPGDLVLFNFEGLQVTNTEDGSREKEERFFEVTNKTLNVKTGEVKVDLTDTNFGKNERYGIISPSSRIASGSSNSFVIIEDSYGELYPGDEQRKWRGYEGLKVLIHDEDFTFQEEITFQGFDPNNRYKMLFNGTLSITPPAGYVVDIPTYADVKKVGKRYKLYHPHLSPIVSIVSGASTTVFDVGAGDVSKFQLEFPVRIHNEDFTDYSPELFVTDITGTTITLNDSIGFTPDSSHYVEFLGFADGDHCYRFI